MKRLKNFFLFACYIKLAFFHNSLVLFEVLKKTYAKK